MATKRACSLPVVFVYTQRMPIALHGDDLHHLRADPALLSLAYYRWGRWRERSLMLAEIAAPPELVHVDE